MYSLCHLQITGKLTVEGTSWRKLFVHSLFAESVCLLENEKNIIKSFLVGEKRPNNGKPPYLFNESQVTVLGREAGCLVGYREGSIMRADCVSGSPLLLCINATWTPIDPSDSYTVKTKLENKEKIDWTSLRLNRNSNVRCSKCRRF